MSVNRNYRLRFLATGFAFFALLSALIASKNCCAAPTKTKSLRPSGKTINKVPAQVWRYDPRLQPIAIDELKRIIRSPQTTPSLHSLISARATNSHLAEYAVAEYDKRRKAQPNNPILQCAFGRVVASVNYRSYQPTNAALCAVQRKPEFLRDAKQVVENAVKGKGATSSFCWAVLGYMIVSAPLSPSDEGREYKRGIDALERAIQLDPKNDGAYSTLAWAYLNGSPYSNAGRALQLARRAAQLNPKSSNAYHFQAGALFQLNRVSEANAMLKKSQALTPPNMRYKTN